MLRDGKVGKGVDEQALAKKREQPPTHGYGSQELADSKPIETLTQGHIFAVIASMTRQFLVVARTFSFASTLG